MYDDGWNSPTKMNTQFTIKHDFEMKMIYTDYSSKCGEPQQMEIKPCQKLLKKRQLR